MSLSSLRPPHAAAAIAAIVAIGGILLIAPWSDAVLGNGTNQPAPVAVNCEPNQQALVRQTMVNGEAQVHILCVGTGQQPVAYVDQYGRPMQMMPVTAMGPTSVGYTVGPAYAPQAVYAPQPAYRTNTVYPQPVAQRQVISERPAVRRRSWTKTAMVIGGSAGTGAGIGGLIGGKKGALIGAAIGGGGASIYEATKR
jgi:hypothetical protein